ncbi:MAG: protein kinase domain-containing protein [Myxococcaceae bacterium]
MDRSPNVDLSDAKPWVTQPMPRVELIGRFAILESRPSTASFDVFLVRDAKTERTLTLKLLKTGAANAFDAQRFRRLQRESEALAKTPHRNILCVYGYGMFENRPYIVMDPPAGQTLADWLGAEKRTWNAIVEKFLEAGQGLAAAHVASVLHRDFRPDNVLVNADGDVRVFDFGLTGLQEAKPPAQNAVAEKLTPEELELRLAKQASQPRGAPYLAPEQRSKIPAGPLADQYSFCYALREALRHSEPPSKIVEQSMQRVLERGLAAAPIARYPRMEVLLSAIGRACRVPIYRKHPRAVMGAAAGTVVGVLIIAGITAKISSSSNDTCGLVQVNALWPAKRDKLIESLPKNAPERQRLSTLLDEFAQTWREERKAHCSAQEALTSTDVIAAESVEKWGTCLDRRLLPLAALLNAADDPNAKNSAGLAQLARSLASPVDCRDPKVRAAFPERPLDPARRVEADRVYSSLAHARAWTQLGQTERATKWTSAALGSAQALGDKATLADALFAQAELQQRTKPADAEALYFSALEAAQAGRHDATAARAALELSKLQPPSKVVDSERWLRLASALGERGPQGNVWQARIELQRAKVAFAKGEDARATQSAQKARGLLPPQSTEEGWEALTLLAEARERAGKVDEACTLNDEALKLAVKLYGAEAPGNLAQRGRCLVRQGKTAEALTAMRGALRPALEGNGAQDPAVSRALVQIGLLESKLGLHAEAAKTFRQSLVVYEHEQRFEDPEFLVALTRYADALSNARRLDEAHNQYTRVVKTLEKGVGPKAPQLAAPLAGLGKLYLALGWYAKALTSLQRGLKLVSNKDALVRADLEFTLARAYWATGEKVRPLRLATEAAERYRAAGPGLQEELDKVEAWLLKRQPVS